MFERILYPTDFSDVAKKGLDFIRQLRDAGAKEVIVLHVNDTRGIDLAALPASKDYMEIERALEEIITEEMGAIEDELKGAGFKVKVRVEKGIPFREILRVEEEENVSAIIVGSHGKSNIEEMLLGSVSEKVIRKARNPVLVIKR